MVRFAKTPKGGFKKGKLSVNFPLIFVCILWGGLVSWVIHQWTLPTHLLLFLATFFLNPWCPRLQLFNLNLWYYIFRKIPWKWIPWHLCVISLLIFFPLQLGVSCFVWLVVWWYTTHWFEFDVWTSNMMKAPMLRDSSWKAWNDFVLVNKHRN